MITFSKAIAGLFLASTLVFAGLWYNSDQLVDKYRSENKAKSELVDNYEDAIYSLDSAYTVAKSSKDSAANVAKHYKSLWLSTVEDKQEINKKYKQLKQGLEGLSLDSLAEYIVKHYAGESYKIQRLNDSLFVAFQDTTVEDIVSKHIDYREAKEVVENQDKQISHLDSLQKAKSSEVLYLESMNDSLHNKIYTLKSMKDVLQANLSDCNDEVDKQKMLRNIGFGAAALELLIIIFAF